MERIDAQLAELRKAMLSVVHVERKYTDWCSPLTGHCVAAALMVQACFGGVLVTGKVNDCPHYWNRLPDGREVDLTSCQFGGDGFNAMTRGRKVPTPELKDPAHLAFILKVKSQLPEAR